MDIKTQICCFTGHRKIPEDKRAEIQKRLRREIINLIRQGVSCFLAGGALGFDTMAALAVLKLKLKFPHIRLVLILPCKEQAINWREKDQKIYALILDQADEAIYTSMNYDALCMQKRNRRLVDNSGICVCYLTDRAGGTAYTVNYAKKSGLRIINIASNFVI